MVQFRTCHLFIAIFIIFHGKNILSIAICTYVLSFFLGYPIRHFLFLRNCSIIIKSFRERFENRIFIYQTFAFLISITLFLSFSIFIYRELFIIITRDSALSTFPRRRISFCKKVLRIYTFVAILKAKYLRIGKNKHKILY